MAINQLLSKIQPQIQLLYPDLVSVVNQKLARYIQNSKTAVNSKTISENDIVLITYGDSILPKTKQSPLQALLEFYQQQAKKTFSAIHILPCFPWTSDDGFSVVDYKTIDINLGDWHDITAIAEHCDLMLDAVVNHISKDSEWFKLFLVGDSQYQNYFIVADPAQDYSLVTRPRALPLLTKFETSQGKKHIWTTFSDDQIDLNFHEPDVLLAIIDVLVFYARKGSQFIRLDAIGFIWKKPDSTCMHLPETHAAIQIMRFILELLVPGTKLISETNVPHEENISYFGNGFNEASLVYQFPLPPLVMHTFLTGNSAHFNHWAKDISPPGKQTHFFNFLASHDGIGVRPVEGLLSKLELDKLVEHTKAQGGLVSYRDNGDGTQSPYELNICYFDAISDNRLDARLNQKRMIAAHALLFSLQGVPAVYIHSFVGSHNDRPAADLSGIARRINRKKMAASDLVTDLENSSSEAALIKNQIEKLASIRRNESMFNPTISQKIHSLSDQLIIIERQKDGEQLWCIINISLNEQLLSNCRNLSDIAGKDLISCKHITLNSKLTAYQCVWLKQLVDTGMNK